MLETDEERIKKKIKAFLLEVTKTNETNFVKIYFS